MDAAILTLEMIVTALLLLCRVRMHRMVDRAAVLLAEGTLLFLAAVVCGGAALYA